jgi:hypothetical protein
MAKTIKLRAAESVRLSEMQEPEIRRLVQEHTEKVLSELPQEVRLSEVNSVILESNPREPQEIGVWGEWTRACSRAAIENATSPSLPQLTENLDQQLVRGDHFDSSFTVKKLGSEPDGR